MIGRYRNLGYTVPKRFMVDRVIIFPWKQEFWDHTKTYDHHIPHFIVIIFPISWRKQISQWQVPTCEITALRFASIRINTLEMGVPSCPTLDIFDVGKLTELSCISSSKGNILNYYIYIYILCIYILSNICSIENYLDINCLYQLCHLEIITFDISSQKQSPQWGSASSRDPTGQVGHGILRCLEVPAVYENAGSTIKDSGLTWFNPFNHQTWCGNDVCVYKYIYIFVYIYICIYICIYIYILCNLRMAHRAHRMTVWVVHGRWRVWRYLYCIRVPTLSNLPGALDWLGLAAEMCYCPWSVVAVWF